MPEFPNEVTAILRMASDRAKTAQKRFVCRAFQNPDWNAFTEEWASKAYVFVGNAFGGFQTEPMVEIIGMHDGAHSGGANASFNLGSGQITLSGVMEGKAGLTLEKITHEVEPTGPWRSFLREFFTTRAISIIPCGLWHMPRHGSLSETR